MLHKSYFVGNLLQDFLRKSSRNKKEHIKDLLRLDAELGQKQKRPIKSSDNVYFGLVSRVNAGKKDLHSPGLE